MNQWLIIYSDVSVQSALDTANQLVSILDKVAGFPNETTQTYTIPLPHPDIHLYEVAMCIEPWTVPYLTSPQKASLVSLDTLVQAGWFPSPLNHH